MKQSALKLTSLFAFAGLALAADQWLKHWVVTNMTLARDGGGSLPLIPGWFALTYTQNFGSAWSMLWGQRFLLIAIAGAVAIGIIVYAARLKERSWLQMAGLGFLLGGAVGNLIDRARLGYVVDMFNTQNGHWENIFPIFNVADVCIDIGVGLLLLYTFLSSRKAKADGQEHAHPVTGAP